MYVFKYSEQEGEPLRMGEESKQLFILKIPMGFIFFFFFFCGRGAGCPSWLMTSIPGVLHSAQCFCSCTAWTTHLTPNLTQNSFFPKQKSSLSHVFWSLILNHCCIHIHKMPVFQTWLIILCYYSEYISYLFKLFLIHGIFIF